MRTTCGDHEQHSVGGGDIFQIMPELMSTSLDTNYLPTPLVTIITILSVIVIMGGVFGNIVIIFLVANRKKLQTWTNGLLLHLTACDLFTEIFLLPTLIWIILTMGETNDKRAPAGSTDQLNRSAINHVTDSVFPLPPRVYIVHAHYALQIILLTMITVSGTLIAIARLLIFYKVPTLTSSHAVKIAIPTTILILSWGVSITTVLYPLVANNTRANLPYLGNSSMNMFWHYAGLVDNGYNETSIDNNTKIFKIIPKDSIICSSMLPTLDESYRSYYDNLTLHIAPQVLLGSIISSICYCLILCKVRRKRNKVLSRYPSSGVNISPYLAYNRPSLLVVGNGTEFLTLSLKEFRSNKRKKYIESQVEQRSKDLETIVPTHQKKALKLIGAGVNTTGSNGGGTSNMSNRKRNEYKPEMTSFMIILISTISYAPITIWCIVMSYNNEPMQGEHLTSLAFLWLLVCMGSAVQPYMYTLKCEAFRKEIRRYLNNARFTGFPFEPPPMGRNNGAVPGPGPSHGANSERENRPGEGE